MYDTNVIVNFYSNKALSETDILQTQIKTLMGLVMLQQLN
jgi:hypothetical protein